MRPKTIPPNLFVVLCLLLVLTCHAFTTQGQNVIPPKSDSVVWHLDTMMQFKMLNGKDTLLPFSTGVVMSGKDVASFEKRYSKLANKKAPVFYLENYAGGKFSLKQLRNKLIYLDLWFVDCPACQTQLGYSAPVHDFYKNDTSIVFVSICIDDAENKERWKEMIQEKKLGGIHLFMDRNNPGSWRNQYYKDSVISQGYPTFSIISKSGNFMGIAPEYSSEELAYSIYSASQNKTVTAAFKSTILKGDKSYLNYMQNNLFLLQELQKAKQKMEEEALEAPASE